MIKTVKEEWKALKNNLMLLSNFRVFNRSIDVNFIYSNYCCFKKIMPASGVKRLPYHIKFPSFPKFKDKIIWKLYVIHV